MTQLQSSAVPTVTVNTTGSKNPNVVKCVHGKFYLLKDGVWYGKKDGINGFSSAKRLERYL